MAKRDAAMVIEKRATRRIALSKEVKYLGAPANAGLLQILLRNTKLTNEPNRQDYYSINHHLQLGFGLIDDVVA
jgi:hypothetical protein